jgi:hypothetical protein
MIACSLFVPIGVELATQNWSHSPVADGERNADHVCDGILRRRGQCFVDYLTASSAISVQL